MIIVNAPNLIQRNGLRQKSNGTNNKCFLSMRLQQLIPPVAMKGSTLPVGNTPTNTTMQNLKENFKQAPTRMRDFGQSLKNELGTKGIASPFQR